MIVILDLIYNLYIKMKYLQSRRIYIYNNSRILINWIKHGNKTASNIVQDIGLTITKIINITEESKFNINTECVLDRLKYNKSLKIIQRAF